MSRLFLTAGVLLMLLIGAFSIIPAAAQTLDSYAPVTSSSSPMGTSSAPSRFFRRLNSESSTSSVSVSSRSSSSESSESSESSVPSAPSRPTISVSESPQVGAYMWADRSRAEPGDVVRYTVKVRNLWAKTMPSWRVAFFFERSDMSIVDAGSAVGRGNHLTWTVPPMAPGAEWQTSVGVRLSDQLQGGDAVQTYVSMIFDGTLSPVCAKNLLPIESPIPIAPLGAGDGTAPLEDTTRFLKPVNNADDGFGLGIFGW